MRTDGELYDECANGSKLGRYSSTALRTLSLRMLLKASLKSTLTMAWLSERC